MSLNKRINRCILAEIVTGSIVADYSATQLKSNESNRERISNPQLRMDDDRWHGELVNVCAERFSWETTLLFQSRTHAKLFIILLTDFLSPIQPSKQNETAHDLKSVPKGARGVDLTFIFHLRQVCTDPQLGDDATELRNKVEELSSWLEKIITSKGVNLANVDIAADIEVERYRYIKMCGNIAKHNLARLNRLISDLRKLLEEAGHEVSIREAHLATEPFFVWFFDDVFMFHSNRIVELLNDIRWRLFEYLQPEYQRSWYPRSRFQGDYGYHIPHSVNDPLAQAMYWDLMNRVRMKPYMPRFVADEAFKRPHWSEDLDQSDV